MSHRSSVTTPSAPAKEASLRLLDVAATPPHEEGTDLSLRLQSSLATFAATPSHAASRLLKTFAIKKVLIFNGLRQTPRG
jgi:hypothetical protein